MVDESAGDQESKVNLSDIDSNQTADEKNRRGKSGGIVYQITYYKKDQEEVREGKITEIGAVDETNRMDLKPLIGEGFGLYGIFRLGDRTTTTIVQATDGTMYKVLSLGSNNVKVSHEVTIAKSPRT